MLHEATARPYLIRAVYEWCVDQGMTPYIAVYVDSTVTVPPAYVKDSQIVLNVSPSATAQLMIDNDFIQFTARFAGQPHRIIVPVNHVLAVYSRENQQGLQFPVNPDDFEADDEKQDQDATLPQEERQKKSDQPLTRPRLHRVK